MSSLLPGCLIRKATIHVTLELHLAASINANSDSQAVNIFLGVSGPLAVNPESQKKTITTCWSLVMPKSASQFGPWGLSFYFLTASRELAGHQHQILHQILHQCCVATMQHQILQSTAHCSACLGLLQTQANSRSGLRSRPLTPNMGSHPSLLP